MSRPRQIECFLIEPTGSYWSFLRRYSSTRPDTTNFCPRAPLAYHNAEVDFGEVVAEKQPVSGDVGVPHDDPRWPLRCDHCAYTFTSEDVWQVHYERQYVHQASGRKYSTTGVGTCNTDKSRDAPDGAIWRADWMEDVGWVGPDARCYIVRTPGGDWIIDGLSSNDVPKNQGGGWIRTGEAPRFTVRPSILIGQKRDGGYEYHAFLTDGRLDEI